MENKEAIRAFLVAQSTVALATVDEAGNPQAVPLFYVSDDDLNLYWLSAPSSRHSRNLTVQERVAATIYPTVWEWAQIRGLPIEGRAAVVEEVAQREIVLASYRHKFRLPPEFSALIEQSILYTLRPVWMRWLDNGVSFGYKAEISLAD